MMKLEKARAFHNMKVADIPHPISSIIYTDEDIVIGKDLGEFVSLVRSIEHDKWTLALFKDTGLSAGELHTGRNGCARERPRLRGFKVGGLEAKQR